MRMRLDCAINGQRLSAVDERIYVTDIRESAPQMRSESAENAKYDGMRRTRSTRKSLSVTVDFLIREREPERRKEVMRRVIQWAQDGWLTLSDRPDQRLRVAVEKLPAVSSAMRWSDTLSLELTAYARPFWEDAHETRLRLEGKEKSGSLAVPGDAGAVFVQAQVINRSEGTLNALTLTAGETFFSFERLGMAPGGVLNVGYGEDGILRAEMDGEGILGKRTTESSDDLLLATGRAGLVKMQADQTAETVFSVRGMYR